MGAFPEGMNSSILLWRCGVEVSIGRTNHFFYSAGLAAGINKVTMCLDLCSNRHRHPLGTNATNKFGCER